MNQAMSNLTINLNEHADQKWSKNSFQSLKTLTCILVMRNILVKIY